MKWNRLIMAGITAAVLVTTAGCGTAATDTSDTAATPAASETATSASQESASAASTAATTSDSAATADSVPEGMYRSELTNEPIDDALKDQRPIAVMVDNEQTALPHYGTADADVVYELMNSTMNNRITRLMCLYKDWEKITQVGSVRSTRPTNILLASEWNAVLCHDGGPYYNDQYFKKDYSAHFSGGFSRVNNGKSREFTEYIKSGDLDKKFKASKYSTTYNEYRPDDDSHFNFSADTDAKLSDTYKSVLSATDIKLPFTHNGSELKYNEKTQTYDYYEYGKVHKDADTGKVLTFKNVILQDCTFNQLDEHGYLIYNCIDTGKAGFYLTNGQAKNISWIKANETDPTRYYDENGDEVAINTGKTYIALVPDDTWSKVTIK